MPVATLRARSLKGIKWTAIENGAISAVQLLVGVILARLMDPAEFGLVAMVSVFIALLQPILDSGFSAALIQKQDASHLDECSVFYFNIAIGGTLTLLLVAASPVIASFYRHPELTTLICVLAFTLTIRSFTLVQRSLLSKQLDFSSQAKAALVACFGSAIVGVSLAVTGFGAWALVAQQLTSSTLRCAMYWAISTWRPTLQFSIASLKAMFGFGSRMMLSATLNATYRNIHAMAIGRTFSATELGIYSRGRDFALAPGQIISMILNRVAFPVMAEIQNDREQLSRGIRKALRTLAFMSFPAMVGLALVAHPFVLLLLGDNWLPMVPILQMLCVAGALYPLQAVHLSLLKAIGRSDVYLRLEFINKLLAVISLSFTLPFGLGAVVAGQSVLSIVAYMLNSSYSAKVIGYSYSQQLIDVFPVVAKCTLMVVVVNGIAVLPIGSLAAKFGLQLLTGAGSYTLLAWLVRSPEIGELCRMSKGMVARAGT